MKNSAFLLSCICLLLLSSCKKCKEDDPKPSDGDKTYSMTFTFTPKFGDSVLAFNKVQYITAAGDTLGVSNLKFLLSEFKLQKQNGEFVNITDYGYLSLATGTRSFTLSGIPKGDYKSIAFMLGLPDAINHGDPNQWGATHPLNPAVNGMHWGWAGGYICNMLEGYYLDSAIEKGYTYHVARDKNFKTYNFSKTFSISADASVSFDVEIDKYFSTPSDFSPKTDGAISHSAETDPIMDKFTANMVNIFNLVSVN